MSSVESIRKALAPHAAALHAIAREAIREGLEYGAPMRATFDDYPAPLRERLASFVTIWQAGDLRGCVGTARAVSPLAEDVARNALGAAFRDARLPPVRTSEFAAISIEVSVLSPLEPLPFANEHELAVSLVPARDGLCLELEDRRGLFLPQVWEMLPDSYAFLDHLKDKAGLPPWPLEPDVRAFRFGAIKFLENAGSAEPCRDLAPATVRLGG